MHDSVECTLSQGITETNLISVLLRFERSDYFHLFHATVQGTHIKSRVRPPIMVSSRSKRWAKSFLFMNGPLLRAANRRREYQENMCCHCWQPESGQEGDRAGGVVSQANPSIRLAVAGAAVGGDFRWWDGCPPRLRHALPSFEAMIALAAASLTSFNMVGTVLGPDCAILSFCSASVLISARLRAYMKAMTPDIVQVSLHGPRLPACQHNSQFSILLCCLPSSHSLMEAIFQGVMPRVRCSH